jgi:two-component system sensor kinase FixL
MSETGFAKPDPASLEAILEPVDEPILTINESGGILTANSAAGALFGHAPGELTGQPLRMLIAESCREEPDRWLATFLNSKTGWITGARYESSGLRKDGTTFPLQLFLTGLRTDGQRILVATIHDISPMRQRLAQLQAILENAADAVVTIDQQGIIDSVNPATERLFGYAQDELLGRNVNILMPAPWREEHDGYIRNYCRTGVARIIGVGREVAGQRKDGSTFPLHLAVSEAWLGNRRLFTGIVRDISELKRAEARLARLNEELENRVQMRTRQLQEAQAELVKNEKFSTLGKVSGGIAHEIRNPLNAVKTSAYYLLNATNASPAKIREHLERIDRQVMLIDNVVTALADVARLPDARPTRVALQPFVRAALSSLNLPGMIQLEIDVPDHLPCVRADQSQLEIAFLNLVRNARDAMPEGGRLIIGGRVTDDYVELSVTDNGTGIPAADLEKVLEPLFTTKARGMGLGLPITRAIVEKNLGTLHMDSELGHGSTFSIRLPAA